MLLTEIQKRVIASVQLQANAPVKVIAAETGLREHTVRHCLESLKLRGYIRSLPYIDVSRLGYIDTGLYFSLSVRNESARQRLIDYLSGCDKISWFAELCGEFQYAAVIYVRKMHEIEEFLHDLAGSCAGEFFNKAVATRVSWTVFRSKHLYRLQSGVESITCGRGGEDSSLDDLDHRILSAMANTPNQSRAMMARELGVPLTTLNYRVRNMETCGVIAGYSYRFRGAHFGLSKFRFLIYSRSSSQSFQDRLYRFAADHPNITCFVHCIGNWDYELSVEVDDLGRIPVITQQLYEGFHEDIASVKVLMVLNHVKTSFFPFTTSPVPLQACA